MPKRRQEIVRHVFRGGRFEDHGLEVDVLPELVAYKDLLVKIAKELWRRNHPDRVQLPANFEKNFSLKFYALEPNCTSIPLCREVDAEEQGQLFNEPDEFDRAVSLVADSIRAAEADKALPSDFPISALTGFDYYGKSLRDDECIEQIVVGNVFPARYTKKTRSWLLDFANRSYEDSVDVTGTVTMAKVSLPRMAITQPDGREIEAVFRSEEEDIVTTALKEHSTARVRLQGRGLFSPDGALLKIVETTHMELLRPATSKSVSPQVPIWEVFQQIIQEVPPEQIAMLPCDAASQHDHYLYGMSRHE
jgi:hypothetical protein